MKNFPITKEENTTSEVIGIISLKEEYMNKLKQVLVDFNLGYIEKDMNQKELINISLTPMKAKKKGE